MFSKKTSCVLATTAFIAAAFSSRGADTAPSEPVTLPETVVTATRTETDIDKTASSVTVITRKEIEDNQYISLNESLRLVPGLTLADRGSPGTTTGIFLRGTKTEHTVFLLDGRPLPANMAGSFNIETLSMDNIERVEVLRGPSSSLYGGSTIGGAVNLITRTGRGLEKPEGSLLLEGGSNNTYREAFTIRGSSGPADYSFETQHFKTDGERINSAYELSNAAGHFGVQASSSLYLETDFRVYQTDVGVPGPATGFGANDPDDHLRTKFFSIAPRAIWQTTENWKQTLAYTYSAYQQEIWNFDFFGENDIIDVKSHFVEYQSEVRVAKPWLLTIGGTLQDRGFTRFNKDAGIIDVDVQEINWSLFLQSQLEIMEGLNFVSSIRYDNYSKFGEATTGRVGLSYRVPQSRTLLHANYGTAFSPPSPQDVQPAFFGNPFLVEPEKSKGWEAGIEQPFWGDKGSVSVTYFQNNLRNLIEFDPNLFVITQVDRARTEGFEVGFRLDPIKEIQFNANYTYLDAENLTQNVRLVRRPRHQVNAGVAWLPVESVRIGLTANYVINREDGFGSSQTRVEDYVNLRLTASWKINKSLEAIARIDNLGDARYQEVLGYPAQRRTFYGGLKYNF